MRIRRLKLTALLVLFFALFINLNSQCEADLILVNGHIFTVEKTQPWAQACAIKNGRFTALGDNNFIKKFQGKNTRIIDLNQSLAVPGFNDAHVHFLDGGLYLSGIDLRGAADENEFKKRIQNYAGKLGKGEWILGGYWDHEAWPSKKHPTKELIDDITGDNPVLIYRLDGHIALANSLALKLSGITAATPNPQGGEIVKDPKTGEPTGILKDIAEDLVTNVIPPPSKDQLQKAIKKALAHANSLGLTSIQDNTSAAIFEVYQELLEKNQLTVRINAWRHVDFLKNFEKIGIVSNFGSDMLRLGTIKIFVDGSMGAGTALFYDPYSDDKTTPGIPIYPEETLYSLVKSIDKAGLQVAAHAIGDKANTWILNAFARAFKENGKREARHRVEHAQVVLPEDILRFRELGIIASIQPSHCIDDMRWAEKRIGNRVKNSYLFNSFVKAGVKVAFGTDWPVESLDPMLTLYAAVTREFPGGGPGGGWFPEEKITLEQAIEFYTLGAAYAEFQEKNKGSVKVGKLADLVVLDKNLFKIPTKEILNTKVDLTILGGKVIYKRKH
ncbi:MAG: amidohydrolase [Candidatus Aminicenantes bacterium]|nr:MAG: amidohydrolase [Candidatus Aminicenantes bacterium]